MNRWFVIAGLVILVLALAFLTQGVRKAAPTEDQEQQMAKEAQAAQAAKVKPAVEESPKAPAAAPEAAPGTVADLPAEEIVGSPATAKHHIEVGWVYDAGAEPNADRLAAVLGTVRAYAQKSAGGTSAQIVNLDVPLEDRSPAARAVVDLGIAVDGNTVIEGSPADAAPGAVAAALTGAIKP